MAKKKKAPPITKEELEQKEKCLKIKDLAILPAEEEIIKLVIDKYEQECISSDTVKIKENYDCTRNLTRDIFENIFYYGANDFVHLPTDTFIHEIIKEWLLEHNKELDLCQCYRHKNSKKSLKTIHQAIIETMMATAFIQNVKKELKSALPFKHFVSLLAKNPNYQFIKPYLKAIDAINDYNKRNYFSPDLKRHFILDIGPTNAGKTYSGMQHLISASSGIYLGPLRLLALEAADTLNENNVICSILTGEEEKILEGATHISSTVEMLDKKQKYQVAVIDECQMIADPERGHNWVSAITSIQAEQIHLCLAPEAENIIKTLLTDLDEEYEVKYHERLVPLEISSPIEYPDDIQQGDAIIVFSRKSVQRHAQFLERCGIKTSIVYGALPYDVRKEEVRKFINGETEVIVATDAIGMGLNLPVKRIIFAESEKFDGKKVRSLNDTEIKQIAGRAGRFGKFDIGYVTYIDDDGYDGLSYINLEKAINSRSKQISELTMDIPYQITSLDIPLCVLLAAWSHEAPQSPYHKRNLIPQIKLAQRLRDLPNDFVMDVIDIPYKSGDNFVPLDDMWEEAVRQVYKGEKPAIVLYEVNEDTTLQRLEDAVKVADLAYGIMKRFGDKNDLEIIEENRQLISKLMIEKLKEDKSIKYCSRCGEKMNSNSPYNMHYHCYQEWQMTRYNDYFDMNW